MNTNKSNHDWTIEWIKKFISFENELLQLKRQIKKIENNLTFLNELEELQYLDMKLRYNIRLHEMNLTKFIALYAANLEDKPEYKDHTELEMAIDRFEEKLQNFAGKVNQLRSSN